MMPAPLDTHPTAQRMAALSRLAGGVAHEFNNALMVINGYAELLSQSVGGDPDAQEAVQTIIEAADRATQITRQLLLFSGRPMVTPADVELGSAIEGLSPVLSPLLPTTVRLRVEVDAVPAMVRIDAGHLTQVVTTLVTRVRDARHDGGEVAMTVSVGHQPRFLDASGEWAPEGHYARLRVRHSGPAVATSACAHLFEPFFPIEGSGRGAGLALAVVYGIVKAAGGYLTASAPAGQGTTFDVYLPVEAVQACLEEAPAPAAGEVIQG